MRLYKFRALGSPEQLQFAKDIITTGDIWCSNYWELNDPMEGVYRTPDGLRNVATINRIFDGKANALIGSLSSECALHNPLMWGYYANGFKGIAIEIEVDYSTVHQVNYSREPLRPTSRYSDERVKEILLNKLEPWEHEREWRYLDRGPKGNRHLGEVKAVYVGTLYPKTSRRRAGHTTISALTDYHVRRDCIVNEARRLRIEIHAVRMSGGKIRIEPYGRAGIP